jgi:hypothetical protein
MISFNEVLQRSCAAGGKLPLLALPEFFEGNSGEDSIAPNQWGFGRPPLAEIYRRLTELEACEDVAWVRVGLHDDTFSDKELFGDSIVICTTSSTNELERRLRAIDEDDGLESDGVVDEPYTEHLCDMPLIPTGYRLTLLVWD